MKTHSSLIQLEPYLPRIVAVCLLILLAIIFTGCKNRPKNDVNTGPIGVFALVSVDGKTMPAEIKHEGAKMHVRSGSLAFTADGKCTSTSVFNVENYRDVNRVVKAGWTRTGSEVTMRWHGAGVTRGTIAGDTFTMNNEGMIFVYQKQSSARTMQLSW